MPATGKQYVTEGELNQRIRDLEKKIEALKSQIGAVSKAHGIPNRSIPYIEDFEVDGSGHVSNVSKKAINARDGLVIDTG